MKYAIITPNLSNLHLKSNLKKSNKKYLITSLSTSQDDNTKRTDNITTSTTTNSTSSIPDKLPEEQALTSTTIKKEEKIKIKPIQQRQKPRRLSSIYQNANVYGPDDQNFDWNEFIKGELPKKLGLLLALIAFSRLGVYVRLHGVDVEAFAEKIQSGGILGYIDTLSGGSISKVGVFSLGIIPYINASILLQILAVIFPGLKRLQREEGAQGQNKFQFYLRCAALVFAVAQAVGQLTYIRPYVEDFNFLWLFSSTLDLTVGSFILIYVADLITELKLGNGSSLLVFANIASSLPISLGATLQQATFQDTTNLAVFGIAFFLTTLGIVYVQEAERRIPMNYASRYQTKDLGRQAYLPFKVNATGVMPVIFASSLLALPSTIAKNSTDEVILNIAKAFYPDGALYLPFSVGLIAFFNWYYTFIQFDPKEVSEQLKKQGASIQAVRPGKATAEFITKTLNRISVLGSVFLGTLAAAPAAIEGITHLTAFRGFAGTSILILVGVASDVARRVRAEQAMGKYRDIDNLYKDLS